MKRLLVAALVLSALVVLVLTRCGTGAPAPVPDLSLNRGPAANDDPDADLAALSSEVGDARAPAPEVNEESAASDANAGAGRIVLRIGPRPPGISTVLGRFVKLQRVDDDDLPEWYEPHPGLAVSLSRSGGGGSGRAQPFDGSEASANEPLEIRWEGLEDGVYRLGVELRGQAGAATTELTGIVVEDGETDPRVGLWDPMLDFEAMELRLRTKREPELFVIAVAEGETGRAYACAPRRDSESETEPVYGPYLVVHGRGRPATVYAFADVGGEADIPFRRGRVTVMLPDRILTGVQAMRVDDVLDLGGREIHLRRVVPEGEWRPPIHPLSVDSNALDSDEFYVPFGVPAPGDYFWTTHRGDWVSDSLRIERVEKPAYFKLPLAPLR
ncbi:MAG: hypothetical protein AAF726_07620 [Planctomycetota bacterium]